MRMTQEYKQRQTSKREEPETPAPDIAIRDEKRAQEVDEMLEEIDGILEENATEFVANYIQKGGQ